MVRGQGLRLWDAEGREYLDASSGGVWCVNVGYGREEIAQAVYDQLKAMAYFSPSGGNAPAAELARRLLGLTTGLARVYYASSGSEATEKIIKILRLRSHLAGRPEKTTIIYRDRDYHGATYGAMSVSGQPERTAGFGPLLPGFRAVPHALCYRCSFGLSFSECELECVKAVERLILEEGPDRVAGAIFEPVTAGGGVIVPPPGYFSELAATLRKYETPLVVDEVVCGLGRTGVMFGHQQFGLQPDAVTMAKGLASAYMPISATAVSAALYEDLEKADDRLGYFRDISTFGGSAAAAAAALANLDVIDRENLLDNVRRQGQRLLEGLENLRDRPGVGDVRGLGLLAGVELVADKRTKTPLDEERVARVAGAMAEKGVLVGRTNRSLPGLNNVINLAPAYVATESDIDEILSALARTLDELGAGRI
jgi:taurine-pyruvate aminotransferase